MTFDEYQKKIVEFDVFVDSSKTPKLNDFAYITKILGLAGESGEVVEKFKKAMRDNSGEISEELRLEILKELGDVLWYTATLARYLGAGFDEVASKNIEKLSSRKERDKILGAGDNR